MIDYTYKPKTFANTAVIGYSYFEMLYDLLNYAIPVSPESIIGLSIFSEAVVLHEELVPNNVTLNVSSQDEADFLQLFLDKEVLYYEKINDIFFPLPNSAAECIHNKMSDFTNGTSMSSKILFRTGQKHSVDEQLNIVQFGYSEENMEALMKLQFLINDIMYDLRSGTPLDLENKYSIFKSAEFTQIQTLGEKVTVQYRFRSLIDYYIFLMMRFIANQPSVTICQCCGKYFIPKTKRTTLYCDRIIRNNKTCKQIAPTLKHKRDAAQDSVIQTFDRTKRKMYKRFERTNDFSNATSNSLSFEQYYDWLDKAEQARDEYLAGRMSAEEALEIITVE